MEEYELLIKDGNIGYYKICEITEIFIHNRNNKTNVNLFTLITFNGTDFKNYEFHKFIKTIGDYSIGVLKYNLKKEDVIKNYEELKNNGIWISNHEDKSDKDYSNYRFINKQFIPSSESIRLNNILKNNFFNGSYILEFFDENKPYEFLFKDDNEYLELCENIKEHTNLDLYLLKDRLGNFIFQFPVTILETYTKYDSSNELINFEFIWHEKINEPPDCLIVIDAFIENAYSEYKIEKYNKLKNQNLNLKNDFFTANTQILRKDYNLLLYSQNDFILKSFEFVPIVQTKKTRKFYNNFLKRIPLKQPPQIGRTGKYSEYIHKSYNRINGKDLEKSLAFVKYPKEKKNEYEDIRNLINKYGYEGTWIWDPYLDYKDILNTLFYSEWWNVELKALATSNQKTYHIHNTKLNKIKKYIPIIKVEDNKELLKSGLNKIKSDFNGMNIEFRIENEGTSHDRFLIFPGNDEKFIEPKVFSLGISVNQFGQKHHILQEVMYPRKIVEEFEKKWKLGECLWKYPK